MHCSTANRVQYWAGALRTYLDGFVNSDPSVITAFAAHNRSGMAGILDLSICRWNGHDIAEADEDAIGVELSALRSAVIPDVQRLENLLFNVADPDGGFLCPVCGCSGDFDGAAFDEAGGVIGCGICRCCLYEPGFDDDPAASAEAKQTVYQSVNAYRDTWRGAGSPWRGMIDRLPRGWDAERQLAHLFTVASYLPVARGRI